MSPLAVAQREGDPRGDDEPRLEIPQSLGGRICLGFDEIQRHFLVNAQASAVVLSVPGLESETENPLGPLRRRWIATMLSGFVSQRARNAKMLSVEATTLSRLGFATGAALLETLSSAQSDTGRRGIDTFLAVALYLRTCSYGLGRSGASLGS